MKASTIHWHIARDSQVRLASFCEKHRIKSCSEPHGKKYWLMTSFFDNGGYITAELRKGDEKSYSVADHYQVVDYSLGRE